MMSEVKKLMECENFNSTGQTEEETTLDSKAAEIPDKMSV